MYVNSTVVATAISVVFLTLYTGAISLYALRRICHGRRQERDLHGNGDIFIMGATRPIYRQDNHPGGIFHGRDTVTGSEGHFENDLPYCIQVETYTRFIIRRQLWRWQNKGLC